MIDTYRLQQLVQLGETLECEFKSENKSNLSDSVIFEEVVAFANSEGGILLIGVSDNGVITGAKARHGGTTDVFKVQSAIFNNTVPNINTRVSWIPHQDVYVLAIEVDQYPEICATSTGKALRRRIGTDGKPQTIPYYPHEQRSRRIDLGFLDFSAQTIESSSFEDFDPLAFERLRQITKLRGEPSLLTLSNEELAKALRLVESIGGKPVPNVAGLLVLGRVEVIERILPTHQVLFQVLDAHENVRVNDSFRQSLLSVIHEIESRFAIRNEEKEVQVGLFRIPIPNYSPEGFREAVNNAILHRDYTQLGAVHIQWHHDQLRITNPGGFPEGITINNILVHEPKPRNPRLAEVFRRIGLVEQTGRGVGKIYSGQLRYGRPLPDYTQSNSTGVRVMLYGGSTSLGFAAFVHEYDRQGNSLRLDELIILNELFFQRRIETTVASRLMQKGIPQARSVLEHLVERGLVEARGERKGRIYHLASSVYQRFKMENAYVRTRGFDLQQQEQMVLNYVQEFGRITRAETASLCQLSDDQASRLLKNLTLKEPRLSLKGQGRGAYYEWK
ncbi:MAG: putative DNA binding domain-containing protein [Anaerolineae bacterium]|nr:putative DNA binding domain-containing protein [Anaerolineae bacterium]